MKKKIKNIIILIVVIAIILGIRFPSTKTLSLDEIKSRIKDTEKIYVCLYSEIKDSPCSKKNRINTVDDKEKISVLIDALQDVKEIENPVTAGSGYYTIYFMDKDDKVLVCANYTGIIVFRTWKKEYVINYEEIEDLNLKELFGTKV